MSSVGKQGDNRRSSIEVANSSGTLARSDSFSVRQSKSTVSVDCVNSESQDSNSGVGVSSSDMTLEEGSEVMEHPSEESLVSNTSHHLSMQDDNAAMSPTSTTAPPEGTPKEQEPTAPVTNGKDSEVNDKVDSVSCEDVQAMRFFFDFPPWHPKYIISDPQNEPRIAPNLPENF